MNVHVGVPPWSADPWMGEEDPYLVIASRVIHATPEPIHRRILWVTDGMDPTPDLIPGDDRLDRERLMYAAHLLTGPVMLGIAVSGVTSIGGEAAESLLRYDQFDYAIRDSFATGLSHFGHTTEDLARRVRNVMEDAMNQSPLLLNAILDLIAEIAGRNDDTLATDLVNMVLLLLRPPPIPAFLWLGNSNSN